MSLHRRNPGGWELDFYQEMEPTEHDVLCGRGGQPNTHPGNIRFHEKALELLPEFIKAQMKVKYVSL
jgi:hypothetical protein